PMYATEVAEELGIQRVLVPIYPGNMSALGLVGSDLRYDFVRTHVVLSTHTDVEQLRHMYAELRRKGAAALAADGFGSSEIRHELAMDMRYQGQAFELSIDVESEEELIERITAHSEALYERRYGIRRSGKAVEIVALRVASLGSVPPLRLPNLACVPSSKPEPAAYRSMYFGGEWHSDCPVFERSRLGQDMRFRGPAIV